MPDDQSTPPVHPAADAFRMLGEDALAALAASITANGLLHPIIVDADGAIVAGRNRYAACLLAEVEPTFEPLGDRDPIEVVLADNEHRRHDTVGQRAMAIARLTEMDEFVQKRPKKGALARQLGVERHRVSEAVYLLRHAPDLADQVANGASLHAAHQEAIKRNETAIARERTREQDERRRRERLAMVEREREQLKADLAAIHAELAEPVEIPPEPDFTITLEKHEDGTPAIAEIERASGPDMKEQMRVLARFRAVVAEIEALGEEMLTADDYWWLDGHVKSIRGWGVRIIAATHRTVERHNELLSESRHLRSLP